jgi:hypothetical protein
MYGLLDGEMTFIAKRPSRGLPISATDNRNNENDE